MIRRSLLGLGLGLGLGAMASVAAAADTPPLSCADAGAMTRVFMANQFVTERIATDCVARPDTPACEVVRESVTRFPAPLRPSDVEDASDFMLWLLRRCAADPAFR